MPAIRGVPARGFIETRGGGNLQYIRIAPCRNQEEKKSTSITYFYENHKRKKGSLFAFVNTFKKVTDYLASKDI